MDLSVLHATNDPIALRDAARALLAQVMAERDNAVVARNDALVERDTAEPVSLELQHRGVEDRGGRVDRYGVTPSRA